MSLPTVVYFISKLACLGYTISATVFETTPLHACMELSRTLNVLSSVTTISTSLLFFFRVRAVFNMNPWVVAVFAGLWLGVVAGSVTFNFGVNAVNIGPTKYCMTGKVNILAMASIILPLINDTLVFIAITWRLYCNSYARRTIGDGIKVLIFGDYLPAFSKAMLQDGQAYYLTTITVNLVTVIMLCNHSIPGVLRTIFTASNIALMNIMACRVYRNTKLGFFRETEISTSLISRQFEAVIPPSLHEGESGGSTVTIHTRDPTFNVDGIAVTQTVESIHQGMA